MKKWYQSKTIKFNIVALVCATAAYMTGHPVPVEVQTFLLTVFNILLRLITKEPIGDEDSEA